MNCIYYGLLLNLHKHQNCQLWYSLSWLRSWVEARRDCWVGAARVMAQWIKSCCARMGSVSGIPRMSKLYRIAHVCNPRTRRVKWDEDTEDSLDTIRPLSLAYTVVKIKSLCLHQVGRQGQCPWLFSSPLMYTWLTHKCSYSHKGTHAWTRAPIRTKKLSGKAVTQWFYLMSLCCTHSTSVLFFRNKFKQVRKLQKGALFYRWEMKGSISMTTRS